MKLNRSLNACLIDGRTFPVIAPEDRIQVQNGCLRVKQNQKFPAERTTRDIAGAQTSRSAASLSENTDYTELKVISKSATQELPATCLPSTGMTNDLNTLAEERRAWNEWRAISGHSSQVTDNLHAPSSFKLSCGH